MNLSALFVPLMAYVQGIDRQHSPEASEVFDQLQGLIKQAREQALANEIDLQRFHNALFPVAAWVDERLSVLPSWRETRPWRSYMLQRKYFSTTMAGVQFFERLQRIEADDDALREVFLMCLALGFVGRFSQNPNAPELVALRQEQYQILRPEQPVGSLHVLARLFPDAYRLISGGGNRRGWRINSPLFWLLVVSIPLVVIGALLFWFDFLLVEQVSAITRRLP